MGLGHPLKLRILPESHAPKSRILVRRFAGGACLRRIAAVFVHRDLSSTCASQQNAGSNGWAVTFMPMPVPKTVCRTTLCNNIVQLEVCITFSGRGMGMKIHSSTAARTPRRGEETAPRQGGGV